MPKEGWGLASWWLTQAGLIGLAVTALATLAVYRILRDRLRIRTLAGVDPLTQLPNRMTALRRLNYLVARGERAQRSFAIFNIDLDSFKPINDTLGHAVGDEVLVAVGQRLRQSVRGSDTIARMGGDEFLVLIDDDDATSDERLLAYAQRIREVLAQEVTVGRNALRVGASIGVAAYPRHGLDAAALLREADSAMYRAKRGKGVGVALANVPMAANDAG